MLLPPQGPPPSGGLAMPPPGAQGGLMPPPAMDAPDPSPAGAGALALAPLAAQQQAQLDALKAQLAQEAMAVAMQAIAGLPNPVAEAAQTEPSGMVPSDPGTDQTMTGGY